MGTVLQFRRRESGSVTVLSLWFYGALVACAVLWLFWRAGAF